MYCTFRPHLGDPLAALRIVVLLLLIGAYGYFAERWLGKFGPFFAFVLAPLLINALVSIFKTMRVAIRVAHVAHGEETPSFRQDVSSLGRRS